MQSLNAEGPGLRMVTEKEDEALGACRQSQSPSLFQQPNSTTSVVSMQSWSAHSAGLNISNLQDSDLCIAEINRRYALVSVGTKLVIRDEWSDLHPEISLETFHGILAPHSIKVGNQTKPVSRYWFEHPDRREYINGAVFAPDCNIRPGEYNTWKGFAVEPNATKSCQLFLNHLFAVICAGDEECYHYFLGWLAHMVQQPGEIPGVAIILGSGQGTGKSLVVHYLGRMYGSNFMTVSNRDHLFGKFADHLNEVILLFADEFSWRDHKADVGLLKVLITEEARTTEKKNGAIRGVHSFIHLIIASNEKWVVPTELSDRRFFVLDVAGDRVGDSAYFERLAGEMDNGGPEALLHLLQTMDVSDFNPRKFPRTKARVSQQLASLEPIMEWLYQFADLGSGPVCSGHQFPEEGWPEVVVKAAFYAAYCQWHADHRKTGSPEAINQFTVALKTLGLKPVKMPQKANMGRIPAYSLPTVEGLRKAIDDALGHPIDWDPA